MASTADLETWRAIQDDVDQESRMGWWEAARLERGKYLVTENRTGWSVFVQDDGSFS